MERVAACTHAHVPNPGGRRFAVTDAGVVCKPGPAPQCGLFNFTLLFVRVQLNLGTGSSGSHSGSFPE